MLKGNEIMDFSKQMELQITTKITQADFIRSILEVSSRFGVDSQHF